MSSRRTNNCPEGGRGLGHVTLQFLSVRSAILATAWLLVIVKHHLNQFLFNNNNNLDAMCHGMSPTLESTGKWVTLGQTLGGTID